MVENFSYHLPTKIVYGNNSIKQIDNYINNRKTLLITSIGFFKRGLVDKIKSYTSNIVGVIADIRSHPEFKDLKEAYERAYEHDFELILALGGGSVMDASKFISVYNDEKDYCFVEKLTKKIIVQNAYKKHPIIAIPTTSGTSSEITPYATIWDMDEKKKYSLQLPNSFCEIAIYDPQLTLTLPKNITIQTGLDALSHSLESIWNKNASPITVDYAVKAAKLIIKNIPKLADNLDNMQYRENMMRACMYAGLAFSNTQTAIAHAMSYYITTNKGTPHGIACSFTLPMLIDNIIGKYDFVDEALLEIFGELSSNKLRNMLSKLDISTKFKDYGIDDKELNILKKSLKNNSRANNSLINI